MHADSLPFCQRNIRLWLTVLGACSVVVLAYSVYLAVSRSSTHVSHPRATMVAPALAQSPRLATVGYPAPASTLPYASAPAPTAGAGGFTWVARAAGPAPGADLQTSFRRAADLIRPAVVSINAIRLGPARRFPGPPGAPRFADPFDGVPDRVINNVPFETVGSGLIIDPAGYVVTNDHLVAGASTFMVSRFQRGNEHLSARLLATDPSTDLALLKIDAAGPFPAASFADSSQVEVGDWVLAVGNPFGFSHTVTAGIISGRRASINIGGVHYQGLLQTDAPINQGSSGGPLCNLGGQVIGINTAIYAPTGVFNGTGFAIPSNRVTAFLARRLSGPAAAALPAAAPAGPLAGAVWLGIGAVDLTPDLALKIGLPGGSGAFVSSVGSGSPAEEAELARGDVITWVGGRPVNGAGGLRGLLAQLPPGQAVPLTVWRQGVERTVNLRAAGSPLP